MSATQSPQTVWPSGSGPEDYNPHLIGRFSGMHWVPCTIMEIHSSGAIRTRVRSLAEEIEIAERRSSPYGCRNSLGVFPLGNRYAATKARDASQPIQPRTRQVKQQPNGLAVLINDAPLPNTQSLAPDSGVLGPWEDSITNNIPSHECFSHLSDFLYKEIVARLNVEGPLGAGTAIKIEAKIGQLVSQDTNTRIRLPVTGEHAINKEDSGLRTIFKSSITQDQHLSTNGFLNKAFMGSQKPKSGSVPPETTPRIPLTYVHAREIDTYYELSRAGILSLPWSIRSKLKAHNSSARVRITTDQKTRDVVGKIIKVCLANLDVHSPHTEFDYRVSVNFEKQLGDEWRGLVVPTAAKAKPSRRNNDRLSYKHLAYQINLSRVTSPGVKKHTTDKAHELSVEVSTAKVLAHGRLWRDDKPNEFEKLVRGFANNIRLFTACPGPRS